MAGTITIPLSTLDPAHGPYTFGPAPAADTDTRVVLAVNRDPAGGLNSLTAAVVVSLTAEQSDDGGATWFLAVATTIPGGQYVKPPPRGDGSVITVSQVQVDLYPGTGRRVRAVVSVTGAAVAVSGTLTVS